MLRLSLVRHAEAASTAAGSLDRHRALTEEGRADAAALGRFLAREGKVPDLVLCSDAVRTVDTAHLLLDAAGNGGSVVVLEKLYHADPNMVLQLIRENGGDAAPHLMIVGHNPTIGALSMLLARQSGQTPAPALSHFAPASCAQFAVQALDWESFAPSHATFRCLLSTADYPAA